MSRTFAVLVAAGLLAGCATSTPPAVTQAQLDDFHAGKTTEQEVVAKLGTPKSTVETYDGNRVDIYKIYKVSSGSHPATQVVDLVTLVEHETESSGDQGQTEDLTFTFDKSGLLLGYAVKDST